MMYVKQFRIILTSFSVALATISCQKNAFLFSLFLVVSMSYAAIAQNLIPNPGFENYIDCPIENHHYSDASNWQTNVHISENVIFEWYERAYIHACDPQVEPWWENELGDAVIKTMYGYDLVEEQSYTRLIWTDLLSAPEKDSLYYVEYTTAPSLLYYPAEAAFKMHHCVPFNLGVKLEGEDFDGLIGELEPGVHDMIAGDAGIAQKIPNTLQIGNCFRAAGSERYFLYGFFLDDTPISAYNCIGQTANSSLRYPLFTSDNFKLEKMKLEVCCDTSVCANDLVDFSEYADYYVLPEKQIVWNDGVEGSKRSFPVSDRYRFTMIANCGSVVSNWIDVLVEDCKLKVYVPNVFSPNGDASNETFAPHFSDDFDILAWRLSVFNRWGQLVFQSHSIDSPGWDGAVKGARADRGVYLWRLEYEYLKGEEMVSESKSGDVLLLR